MSSDNSEQIADWNGPVGERWARLHLETERLVSPFGLAALDAAAARSGEHVMDLGCGAGATTIALGKAVAPEGSVLGVDVSGPLLEVAHADLADAHLPNVRFVQADASVAHLPSEIDLVFSRFGIMFFAEPVAAFAHIRRAMSDSGRLVFCCWRHPRENPWAMTPLVAARKALNIEQAKADLNAPGPFAFHDDTRVRAILLEAGFRDVASEAINRSIALGSSAEEAAERMARVGPLSRFVREVGEERAPEVIDAAAAAMAPHADDTGEIRLAGSAWLITADAG
ncbi:MAG: methyltransferase domain-containing protein [Hyphomonadaceae bacterium]